MTTVAKTCKVNSVHIGSWILSSNLNTLFADSGTVIKNIVVADIPVLTLGSQTSVTKIPSTGVFEMLFNFDSSLFQQSYDSFGIKLLHSDTDVNIDVYDRSGTLKGSNFTIMNASDLQSPIHIVFKYKELPSNVALDLYGVSNDTSINGSNAVESVVFGFVKIPI